MRKTISQSTHEEQSPLLYSTGIFVMREYRTVGVGTSIQAELAIAYTANLKCETRLDRGKDGPD